MKHWKELSDTDKKKLLAYEKAMKANSPVSLILTRYCVEKELCVSMIPEKKIYDETYQKIHLASPMVFVDLYDNVIWVDENDNIIEMF